ncbi:hypothetical protein GMA12_02660 [Kocuria sediminis]|uniref:MFS transporter n=1 Tax=Kocuria sediminis TaxID=1038857 RepID=A0A6N8GFR9_9MICC|nr:hypothetical protein [Kocuria sediminis]MUN62056.1 hypothetical protein [Kocuria sediminis]
MSSRARRLARGWAGAGLATSAAAASHTVAGGPPPPALLVLLSLALSAPLCMALAGRALSRSALALSVLLSQSLFHALFAASGTVSAVTDAAHHGAAGPALVLQAGSPPEHGGSVMLTAHVLAALAGYALMRHGEVAVLVLLEALRLRVRRLWRSLSAPVVAGRPRAVRPGRPHALTDQSLLRPVRSHRGPPHPRRRLLPPAGPALLPVG